MIEWLAPAYLWLKAIHLAFVISWMAGIFYLPRLFVYHVDVEAGSDQDKLFQLMERRLLRIIMNPAMVGAWVFGILLILTPGVIDLSAIWVWVKGAAIVTMTVFHMSLAKWRRLFEIGENTKSAVFFRKANEIPTLLMLAIVFMVILKPF